MTLLHSCLVELAELPPQTFLSKCWYEGTNALDYYVRFMTLDFSKAFDLGKHHLLLEKLLLYGLWMYCNVDGNVFIGHNSMNKNRKLIFALRSSQRGITARNISWS